MAPTATPRPSLHARSPLGRTRRSLAARLAPETLPIALFCAWALMPIAILFGRVGDGLGFGTQGRFFTGIDQINVPDQLQYMAWIRDSGEHGLFSNHFDLAPDPNLFLHPMWLVSGVAWKLGAGMQVAYLMWRPVAVAVVLVGFVAYVRRLLPDDAGGRAAALLLALFAFPLAAPAVAWLDLGDDLSQLMTAVVGLEMFPGGYTAQHLVVGLMPLFLLALEPLVVPERRRPGRSATSYAVPMAVAGLLTSWLHPWQGLTLLGIVGGVVVWGRLWSRLRVLALPALATAAPFPYYLYLSNSDSSWEMAANAAGMAHWGWWLAITVGPALLLALPGVPGRGLDLQEKMLRLWPLAAAVVYVGLQQSWFYHALMGLSLPLAVLTVRGLRRLRAPRPAVASLVALSTVPGCAFFVQELRKEAPLHFLEIGEARALRHLDAAPGPGGVLAREPLATAVPAFSGRKTWTGHTTWTPDYEQRRAMADALFAGSLGPEHARALVDRVGARFLLADCAAPADMRPLLGDRVASVRRFGCARVYELRDA